MEISFADPAYCEKSVPNLDGCEGHSDHVIFGSNVDLSVPSEDGATQPTTGQPEESEERTRQQGDAAEKAEEPPPEANGEAEVKTPENEQAAKL